MNGAENGAERTENWMRELEKYDGAGASRGRSGKRAESAAHNPLKTNIECFIR